MAPVASDRMAARMFPPFCRKPSRRPAHAHHAPRVLIAATRAGRVLRGENTCPMTRRRPSRPTFRTSKKVSSPISSVPRRTARCSFRAWSARSPVQRQARMAHQQGARHCLCDDRGASGRRAAVQRGADRLRRGLPSDEPGRGYRPDGGEDRHAGEIPRAQTRAATKSRCPCSPRRPRDGRLEARRGRNRRRGRERPRAGRRRHEPDGFVRAGHYRARSPIAGWR